MRPRFWLEISGRDGDPLLRLRIGTAARRGQVLGHDRGAVGSQTAAPSFDRLATVGTARQRSARDHRHQAQHVGAADLRQVRAVALDLSNERCQLWSYIHFTSNTAMPPDRQEKRDDSSLYHMLLHFSIALLPLDSG